MTSPKTDWRVESLLTESREAEAKAKALELRARQARRAALKARVQAWNIQLRQEATT